MNHPYTFNIPFNGTGAEVKTYFSKHARLNIPFLYTLSRFYYNIKTHRRRWAGSLMLLTSLLGKKNLHILLADDDEEDREIFISALREVAPDVQISVARDGRELMRKLGSADYQLPDIVFLDLNMPVKNGYECLEEIRSNEQIAGVPVVIYSTSNSREHIDDTYRKGADLYICKPESFADLKVIAGKLLAHKWGMHTRPLRENFVLKAG